MILFVESDSPDAQADLDLHCPHMPEDIFYRMARPCYVDAAWGMQYPSFRKYTSLVCDRQIVPAKKAQAFIYCKTV